MEITSSALNTFCGGVHPPCYKEPTCCKPITEIPLPEEVAIPLSQHIGAPCEAIIKVGEHVNAGQKIATSSAFISAPIHASVSGTIIAIEHRPHFTGLQVNSIVIKPDLKQEEVKFEPHQNIDKLSVEEIRNIVKEAGLVGMGGAAFPTYVKLSPPKDKPIDSVIINGCECEPFLTCDHRIMLEQAENLITGVKIIMKASNAHHAYIGIEVNKMDAIEAVNKFASKEKNISVTPLVVKYPEGGEKQLIKAILNREVPLGKLPSEVGALVQNIQTTVAIAEAVVKGKPLYERVLTVSGPLIKNPQNLKVRIGTPIKHVIEQCGGFKENPEKYILAGHMRYDTKLLRLIFKGEVAKVIVGGPMTGFAQADLNAYVVKGTSGILAFPENMIETESTRPCLKCGKCNDVCSMFLMPSLIGTYVEKGKITAAEKAGVLDCIECGACAFVCPGHRPLIQYIRIGKGKILAKRKAAVGK
ncbi:MAG: electron transport complex subunit RsxC [bacterium]